jgi:hypothetical protein
MGIRKKIQEKKEDGKVILKFKNIVMSFFCLFLAAPVFAPVRVADCQTAARARVTHALGVVSKLDGVMESDQERTKLINLFFTNLGPSCSGMCKRVQGVFDRLKRQNSAISDQMDDLDPRIQELEQEDASFGKIQVFFDDLDVDTQLEELGISVKNSGEAISALETLKDVFVGAEGNPVDQLIVDSILNLVEQDLYEPASQDDYLSNSSGAVQQQAPKLLAMAQQFSQEQEVGFADRMSAYASLPFASLGNPVGHTVAVQKKKKKVRSVSKKALRARLKGKFSDLQADLGGTEIDFLLVKSDDETRKRLDKKFKQMLKSCEVNFKKVNSRKALNLASLTKMQFQATVYEKFLKKASNCKSWCEKRVQAYCERLEADPNYETFDYNGDHVTTCTDFLQALLKKSESVTDQAQ